MSVLGIVLIVLVPFFAGTLLNRILGGKEKKIPVIYGLGIVVEVLFFFVCILASLKLDLYLEGIELLFGVGNVGIVLVSVPFVIKGKGYERLEISKRELIYIVPAILLAVYSYVYLSPEVVNDDTFEIIATTISTRTIYTYSSMTGKLMEAGLPIFNKIYVMPMLLSCLVDFFHIPTHLLVNVVVPVIVYTLNLLLVRTIAKANGVKNIESFMVIYLMLLMAGTYLPAAGIPVTVGFSVLRQGFSGYAVFYGIAFLTFLISIKERSYIHAAVSLMSVVALVKLDRVFFALKNPIKLYLDVNQAGKLVALYFVAAIIAILLKYKRNQKLDIVSFFMPGILVASVAADLYNLLYDRKKRIVYSLSLSVIIFATAGFKTFSNALPLADTLAEEQVVLQYLDAYEVSDECIWASDEFMSVSRRVAGNVPVLYGRDAFNPMLAGADYEIDSVYVGDYRNTYLNMTAGKDFYPVTISRDEAIRLAMSEGVKVIIR